MGLHRVACMKSHRLHKATNAGLHTQATQVYTRINWGYTGYSGLHNTELCELCNPGVTLFNM